MQPKVVSATQSRVECELYENHPLRLVGAEGRRVQCLNGTLWITAYNQPIDVFLRPGGVYVVPNDGLVLAEAIGSCRMRVDVPRALDYHPRVPARLQRLLSALKAALRGRRPQSSVCR
jgi:hypothetical protein